MNLVAVKVESKSNQSRVKVESSSGFVRKKYPFSEADSSLIRT